jgi:hypothetical protein
MTPTTLSSTPRKNTTLMLTLRQATLGTWRNRGTSGVALINSTMTRIISPVWRLFGVPFQIQTEPIGKTSCTFTTSKNRPDMSSDKVTRTISTHLQSPTSSSSNPDSVLPDMEVSEPTSPSTLRNTPPPEFLVLRSNSLKPERLPAADLEEAKAIITRQTRISQVSTIFLYQLVGVEVFVPSSEFLPPSEITAKLFPGSLSKKDV